MSSVDYVSKSLQQLQLETVLIITNFLLFLEHCTYLFHLIAPLPLFSPAANPCNHLVPTRGILSLKTLSVSLLHFFQLTGAEGKQSEELCMEDKT